MTIELNGEAIDVGAEATVATAVARLGAGGDRRGVAVAVDGEVIPRSAWEDTPLSEGQKIEIVGAIQGG